MRKSNPTLERGFSKSNLYYEGEQMTLAGTINKTFMLFSLMMVSSIFIWSRFNYMFSNSSTMYSNIDSIYQFLAIGGIGAFIFAMITSFKPNIAKFTAPVYALLEGLAIGSISLVFEVMYPGIVAQAILLTFAIFLAMLLLYKFKIIKATNKLRKAIFSITLGIALIYFSSFILNIFNIQIPLIHSSGPIGILFSLVVISIASFNLIFDFEFIERASNQNYPKHMEWYGAFGLMVTLVWLYMELLKLLAKFNNRD